MYEDRERRDFQVRKSNKVYVSNLSGSITEDDLKKYFGEFGPIQSVNLKQKETINFAFIEFNTIDEAEAAINEMNNKNIGGQDIKVQFARGGNDRRGGFGDRGRGRSFGDRGGFQNRSNDYGDRPPRRDFGDRPRGCFNCGEEGHMIKDCPKPRKPREFNNREGGYERRGGYNSRDGGEDRGYGNRSYGDRGDRGGSRSYGGDRGDRGDRSYGSRGGDYKKRNSSGSRSRSRSNEKRHDKGRRARSPDSSRSR